MNEQSTSFKSTHLIRESVFFLIMRVLGLQIALTVTLFLLLGVYQKIPTSLLLGWLLFAAVVIHTFLIMFVFLAWKCQYYIVKSNHIVYRKGIIRVHKDVISLSSLGTVSVEQGIVGRVFGYGNVVIASPILEEHTTLRCITSPEFYGKIIQESLHYQRKDSDQDDVEVIQRQRVKKVMPSLT